MNGEESHGITGSGSGNAGLYMTYTIQLLLGAGVGESTVQKIVQTAEEIGASPAEVAVSWLEEMASLHD